MSGGLINDTFALGNDWVLQRLHPIFGAEVNLDIAELTVHLRADGVEVPEILRTNQNRPWVQIDAPREQGGGVWRVMSRLAGRTLHRLQDPAQAQSAAMLVAHFHRALANIEHRFHFSRAGAHDTVAHLDSLQSALSELSEHRLFAEVQPLAREIESLWRAHGELPDLPKRIGHGDLKVSNLLFDSNGDAKAVLDLDTMAWLTLDVELGDALRSWCNTCPEDALQAQFSIEIFEAALQGYGRGASDWLSAPEKRCVVPGLIRICLELSARFAADALRESYFGWSEQVAPTRGEHNLLRARNQLDLARQVIDQRASLETIRLNALG